MTTPQTPYWPSISTLQASIRDGSIQPTSLSSMSQERITACNEGLNAFLHVAEPIQAIPSEGPLHGIPIAVKDNISVQEMPLTCGSKILSSYRPNFHASVITRLLEAGAVIAGKTNMDEFAMGSSTEYSAFGPTRNPWDLERIPGGSSGGSAAAVAAGLVPVALGSDTGGSVRQPAALCGIVGFKPSYGTVSRFGLVLYGSSLDQIGVLGNSTRDIATVFRVIRGPDGRDETVSPGVASEAFSGNSAPEGTDQKPRRIGIISEFAHHPSVDPAIRDAVNHVTDLLKSRGHIISECSLPDLAETAVPAYYLTACAEASSNLNRFDGIRFGCRRPETPDDADLFVKDTRRLFGPETRLRIMLGTFILRTGHYDRYYSQAQAARRRIAASIAEMFRAHDFLLTPTFPVTAPRFGELMQDPLAMKLADIFTVTANLAGIPAISLPVGLANGLPTAVQFMGARFQDDDVLQFSGEVEDALDFNRHRPPFPLPTANKQTGQGESR